MRTSIIRVWILFVAAAAIAACGPGDGGGAIDAAPADAERPIDAGPPPDALGPDFGAACTVAADCPGGVCVDGPDGNVCTYGCTGNCPLGWACRVTEIEGVLESLCLPVVVNQCVPCTSDDQCPGGACIDLGDDQRYCLPSCFESACPTGYTCADDPSGVHAGGFCLPETGSCSCNADNDGALRTCSSMNGVGTCYGVETCDPDVGWTGCNAPDAVTEICDGLDNDCDFLIDDGVGNGAACSNDVAGVGSCPGVALCTGAGGLICQGPTPTAEICDYDDDDCDSSIDEGFPTVGDLCTDGIGGCERFGVVRCDGAGSGVECSAVAGTPVSELCNGIDDNCNGPIDETFPTLGNACTAGTGICQRQGNLICNVAQTGTTCSASPGPAATETCNTLDDDCLGDVDEGWKNQATGLYDANTACGSCAVDCTVIYGLPHAAGSCVVSGTPGCVMSCASNYFNLNAVVGDGCEFLLENAIYVSTSDPGATDVGTCGLGPIGTGAGNFPCKTIARGLVRAGTTGRPTVLVANGIYPESVTMVNGKSLKGGYQWDTWGRDVASTGTMITGVAVSGNDDTTVIASGITVATLFDGFVVFGSVNAKASGNSYAIYASGSNGSLTLSNNVIFGGRGGLGSGGGAGSDGAVGTDGTGRASNPAAFDAKLANSGTGACDVLNNRPSSGGAVQSCGVDDVSGGNGGGNRCPVASTCTCTDPGCSTCTFTEFAGIDGLAGQPGNPGGAGGAGADAGYDMVLHHSSTNGDQCYISSVVGDGQSYGLDGPNGVDATGGVGVAGCAAATGSVVGGHWRGAAAATGNAGGNGGGGGGGGAGGGSRCVSCTSGKDSLGGHGGGGAAGGCGGIGGGGAQTGGGAFGVFVVGTTVAPVITGNRIYRGEGGGGGVGGSGGTGGPGGLGGAGGLGVAAVFCADPAGRGGNGGDGGHGSGGGGGCGGMSEGIYTSGITGTPNYCMAVAANTISSGGAGAGGAGGYSLVNPGGVGAVGVIGTCSFN